MQQRGWVSTPLTPFKAIRILVVVTTLVTIAGGVLIRLVDHREFSDIGTSLWWSLQTVSTVGYGDIVPTQTGGRIIGAVLMLQGIGFITVLAASVTAALVESRRAQKQAAEGRDPWQALERVESRLEAIERALTRE
jgi:voltage-gated potassium channel